MSQSDSDMDLSVEGDDINMKHRKRSRSRSKSPNKIYKNKKTHHSCSIYKKYTIEFKLQILNLAEKHSLKYISKE